MNAGNGYAKPITRRSGERGFSLALIAVCAVVMFGMMGLAYDLGRMFIVKNELQTFADASAMAAVAQMDGSQQGIINANTIATVGPLGTTVPNGYNFDSTVISNVVTTYATSLNGTYDSYATAKTPATNLYRFVKVTAAADVSLSFMPALPGITTTQALSTAATAGQESQPGYTWNGGLVPFAPDAHNISDTQYFGFTPGLKYTLKWGNGNTTNCAGDAGFSANLAPDAHGFVDIGQGNSTSGIRDSIVNGGYPNPNSTPSSVGDDTILYQDPGNRGSSIFAAMATRSAQDTDQTSTTYAQYQTAGIGNGRRIVTAPVVDPATWNGRGRNYNAEVVGFGNFLLDLASTISGSSGPICATYIGPGNLNGAGSGATDGSIIYLNNLFK